ncbi:MAG: hypothetical protein LQ351_000728 [Letrouitia transgressa]|nr:MAG: hypothetical protein LQ351_000728 [Letrouitia transgressa]
MALSDPLDISAGSEDEREREQRVSSQINDDRDREREDIKDVHDIKKEPSIKLEELLSHILRFLSTANNETLAACLVALCATTYVVLGRVGLVLIGIVVGVVTHATWEEHSQDHIGDEFKARDVERRREAGLRIAERVLDWRQSENDKVNLPVDDSGTKSQSPGNLNYSCFQPTTEVALTNLTDAVIQDYAFTSFLLSISSHLSRKRPADAFLDFLTNSSSIVIVFLNELSAGLTISANSGLEPSEALQQYLDQNPNSNLANVLDISQQRRKLKAVAEDILQTFLDPKAYNCEPVRVFLREILAGICLETTVQSCSKSDWINGWVVYLLEEGEPELMNAIDAGVGGAATSDDAKDSAVRTALDDKSKEILDSSSENTLHSKGSLDHRRTVSRAEDAMEEAMQEAKRLTELIAAEEAKRQREFGGSESSSDTTARKPTPTSSMSDLGAYAAASTPSIDGESPQDGQPSNQPIPEQTSSFTTFDQIIGSQSPTALQSGHTRNRSEIPPLTLHNANISIFDDSAPGEKGTIRSKPTADYLLQVEPASSQHPGWMIARKYADFETLHEVLRRISVVSGVPEFVEMYANVPPWKNSSKTVLRGSLERYLRDALAHNRLAESEGMKRFLEKDQGLSRSSPGPRQGGFGFPSPAAFESMGKGVLDVLSSAPKGAAGGGKALLGGVTGVLGGVGSLGQKRQISVGASKSAQSSNANLSRIDSLASESGNSFKSRVSQDVPRKSVSDHSDSKPAPPLPSRSSFSSHSRSDTTPASPLDAPNEEAASLSMSEGPKSPPSATQNPQTPQPSEPELHLPPPPSEIADDYTAQQIHKPPSQPQPPPPPSTSRKPNNSPITEQETRVAIELFFAVINELYNLSSAWNIRRTLLNAAKSYLLRPGNPNLEAIRCLIQDTIIEANTSDAGIAAHLQKLRENALPTEEERRRWEREGERGEEEKLALRRKARRLLVEKGMPQALMSVMGAAASGEALGRVFDCLQVERVARGLMFALVLQGVRAVTQ